MSSYKDKIDKTLLPKHIAIIMDDGRKSKEKTEAMDISME